jgi:hypothetical protein
MKLAACAIFKDEGPYLREWIDFHLDQGIEQFYLYDHQSRDDSRDVVLEMAAAGISIELQAVTGISPQMPVYSLCLEAHRDDADWIAFIDIDEFLFSPEGPLPAVLDRYTAYPAVVANWAVYGPGGHDTPPAHGRVVESYLFRADADFGPNQHVKSIVQPRRTCSWPISDPHSFSYLDGSAVNERFEPVVGPFSLPVSWDVLRVNHYWSKSVEEAQRKTAKPRADCVQPRMPLEALVGPETSAVYDPAALRRYLAAMGSQSQATW